MEHCWGEFIGRDVKIALNECFFDGQEDYYKRVAARPSTLGRHCRLTPAIEQWLE